MGLAFTLETGDPGRATELRCYLNNVVDGTAMDVFLILAVRERAVLAVPIVLVFHGIARIKWEIAARGNVGRDHVLVLG
jgi:hypothetical protein